MRSLGRLLLIKVMVTALLVTGNVQAWSQALPYTRPSATTRMPDFVDRTVRYKTQQQMAGGARPANENNMPAANDNSAEAQRKRAEIAQRTAERVNEAMSQQSAKAYLEKQLTMAGSASALGLTAIAVGSAPLWVSILTAALLTVAVTGIITYTLDAGWALLFDPKTGKVTEAKIDPATGKLKAVETKPVGDPFTEGQNLVTATYSMPGFNGEVIKCQGTTRAVVAACIAERARTLDPSGNWTWSDRYANVNGQWVADPSFPSNSPAIFDNPTGLPGLGSYRQQIPGTTGTATVTCPGGAARNGTCVSPEALPAGAGSTQQKSIEDAIKGMPESEYSKPLNPWLVSDYVNQMWKNAAAQPGYDGMPYNSSDPVTQNDVNVVKAQNPQLYPTGAQLHEPVTGSPGTALPIPDPNTTPNPNANPGAIPQTNPVNLGVDPQIGMPGLEATPTGADILSPFAPSTALPYLAGWTWPANVGNGACPVMSFNPKLSAGDGKVWDEDIVWDQHCPIVEKIRPEVSTIMIAIYHFAVLLLILSA